MAQILVYFFRWYLRRGQKTDDESPEDEDQAAESGNSPCTNNETGAPIEQVHENASEKR